ncbi:hypothetical protein MMC22_004637 [Lobaria immixta]|nr:hypothetical protein [Lobaria immixta]
MIPSSTDISVTSRSGQRIKRELDLALDLEENTARASKRIKSTGDAECFGRVEIPEKSRSSSTQRLPDLVETSEKSVAHENTIRGAGTQLELSELETTYDQVSNNEVVGSKFPNNNRANPILSKKLNTTSIPSVPSQPSTIPKIESGEPSRHSDAPPKVQSAAQNDRLEVLDKATYCRLAYRETKKKVKSLKLQLLEEKRIWKEEEEKREAEEMGKLLEEQKRLSKLMKRTERRLAKLKRRALRRTGSNKGEGGESRKARENSSDGRAQEMPDRMLLKSRKMLLGNDPSKGYFDGAGWWIPYPGRKCLIRRTSQNSIARRPELNVEETTGEGRGTLAGVENSASSNQAQSYTDRGVQSSRVDRPPQTPTRPFHRSSPSRIGPLLSLSFLSDASSSQGQPMQKHNPQETAVPKQAQAKSDSLQAKWHQGVPVGAMRGNSLTAPSVLTITSLEQAPQPGNANPRTSPPVTPHDPLNLNGNGDFGHRVEPLHRNKEKNLYPVEKSCQPESPSNIPMALRKSDQELVQIGKLPSGFERNQEAPYAFTRYGKVRAAYFRLGDLVDDAGDSVWTAQELRRLFQGLGRAVPGCSQDLWYKNM